MRPWLLLPVLLPALWAGITYAALWPEEGPGWLASPLFAVVVTFAGIALAMLADSLVRRPNRIRRRSWWRRTHAEAEPGSEVLQQEPLYQEPLVSSETPIAQAWNATRAHFRLQVEMPERRTETPAPRG